VWEAKKRNDKKFWGKKRKIREYSGGELDGGVFCLVLEGCLVGC
jgi:hypothetical protein